jgi:Fe-S cluster biogenesis protein NfuA
MEREELLGKVKETLDQIRPYLQMDGGDLEFVEMSEDNVVRVRLKGACSGCPGAAYTLKLGVERKLKEVVPEIKAVESVAF